MNKVYCSNVSCAKPNYYEAAKPKFCAHCGQSLNGGFSATQFVPQVPQQAQPQFKIQSAQKQPVFKIQEVEEEADLSFAEFKIGTASLGKKVTLRDIQAGGAIVPDQDRSRGGDLDAEKVQTELRRRSAKKGEIEIS